MDDHRHFSYITNLEVKKGKKKRKKEKRYSSKAYHGCWALWRAFGFFLIWRPFIYLFVYFLVISGGYLTGALQVFGRKENKIK
jgi:hypothetical protein